MSLILMEGFDQYTSVYDITKGNMVNLVNSSYDSYYELVNGYRGGKAIKNKNTTSNNGIYVRLPQVFNSGIIGCWFKVVQLPTSNDWIVLRAMPNTNTDNWDSISVYIDTSLRLYISPTVFGTISNKSSPISLSEWTHLEFKYQRLNTTTIKQQLRINGILSCECPIGIDTVYSIENTNHICFGANTSENAPLATYDHAYFLSLTGDYNNDFIGPYTYIQTLVPTGNGSTNQWSKSPATGLAWDLVDDYIDSTGTYVYSSTSGVKELYNLPSLTGNISTIKAVGNHVAGTKYGLLDMSIKHLADSNSVMATSGLTNVGFTVHSAFYETNPSTNLPWTTGEFDSTQFGFELHYTGV